MDYIKLIEKINQDLYELIPDKIKQGRDITSFIEENPPLEIKSIGYAHVISFFGVPIWSSENDERPYENEDNPKLCDQISLEKWIWQEIKRILFLTKQFGEILNKEK